MSLSIPFPFWVAVLHRWPFISDVAVFVLKRDIKLQQPTCMCVFSDQVLVLWVSRFIMCVKQVAVLLLVVVNFVFAVSSLHPSRHYPSPSFSVVYRLALSLPTATDVTGILFAPLFVCFYRRYLKNRCSKHHQTSQRNVPPDSWNSFKRSKASASMGFCTLVCDRANLKGHRWHVPQSPNSRFLASLKIYSVYVDWTSHAEFLWASWITVLI